MGLSKVEVNLRRLLEAAPRQQNQAKLVHISRGLLKQLGAEATPEGISSVWKAKPSEYSEKVETLAATLFAPVPVNEKLVDESREESSYEGDIVGTPISVSSGLRRRSTAHVEIEPRSHDIKGDSGASIKLDAEAQAHIAKHRSLIPPRVERAWSIAWQAPGAQLCEHGMSALLLPRQHAFSGCSSL